MRASRNLIWATVSLVLLGCGPPSNRRTATGEVTLDGAPLKAGRVVIEAKGPGPTAAAAIVDGKFEISGEKGPIPGAYIVRIVSKEPTGRMIQDPDSPTGESPETANVIPDRYNHGQLTMEVTPDGTNHFQFDLSTK